MVILYVRPFVHLRLCSSFFGGSPGPYDEIGFAQGKCVTSVTKPAAYAIVALHERNYSRFLISPEEHEDATAQRKKKPRLFVSFDLRGQGLNVTTCMVASE